MVIEIANQRWGVSRKNCHKILRIMPNKPRHLFNNRDSHAMKKIEAHGGLKLIKALQAERYSIIQIAKYMDVHYKIIHNFIEKKSWILFKKSALTDEDVSWVKKKYGIK